MTHIYSGRYAAGVPAYTFDGTYIYEGRYAAGVPKYTFDGTYIYNGRYAAGVPVYTFDGTYIYNGRYAAGVPAYTFDGTYLYEGRYAAGVPVFTVEECSEYTSSGSRYEGGGNGGGEILGGLICLLPYILVIAFVIALPITVINFVRDAKQEKARMARQESIPAHALSTAHDGTWTEQSGDNTWIAHIYVDPKADNSLFQYPDAIDINKSKGNTYTVSITGMDKGVKCTYGVKDTGSMVRHSSGEATTITAESSTVIVQIFPEPDSAAGYVNVKISGK